MIARDSRLTVAALLVLTSALIASACNSSPTAPTVNVPFSQTDLNVGTGDEAVAGATMVVSYAGWLYDPGASENKGLLFDSTPGSQAFVFVLGVGAVIPGWDQGVPGMRVGGRRRLVIPPALAYGSAGSGPIPPNATLVFEISLAEVQ